MPCSSFSALRSRSQRHGGWQHANAQGGSNINWLLPVGETAVERVSGTTVMDGLAVTIERLADTDRIALPA